MRTLWIPIAALMTALSVPACAPTTGAAPAAAMAPEQQTTVEVTNRNWRQVVVYLEADGMRHRLGIVNTGKTQQFAMPRSVSLASGDVRLVADPIGTDDVFSTERIPVRRGQEIELTVQNQLPISSYAVWTR